MCSLLDLEDCQKVAVEVARKAGELIKDTCGKVQSVECKLSEADLVTETDKNVEKFVFDQLRAKFPNHKFIGEESVAASQYEKVTLTDEPTWIVDPVDGTMNFVHTFPYVAVAIGLSLNKKPVLGVVYCPSLDQMFSARKGKGAFCNNQKITVKPTASLKESLILAEIGSDRNPEKRNCVFKNLDAIGWQSHGLRALGSAAMNICAVAQGQANAFYEFGLHCWDMCAPGAILLEAGGTITDTTGGPFNLLNRRIIAASSEGLTQELAKAMVVQLELPSD